MSQARLAWRPRVVPLLPAGRQALADGQRITQPPHLLLDGDPVQKELYGNIHQLQKTINPCPKCLLYNHLLHTYFNLQP